MEFEKLFSEGGYDFETHLEAIERGDRNTTEAAFLVLKLVEIAVIDEEWAQVMSKRLGVELPPPEAENWEEESELRFSKAAHEVWEKFEEFRKEKLVTPQKELLGLALGLVGCEGGPIERRIFIIRHFEEFAASKGAV